MIEVDCRKCENCTGYSCKIYGSDAKAAVDCCSKDLFINYRNVAKEKRRCKTKNYKDYVDDIKGTSYITCIPIEEFTSIYDLEAFVKHMKNNGIGTVLHYETSNFHYGVVVQVYDIETCEVKEYLGGAK